MTLPLISIWNHLAQKANHTTFHGHCTPMMAYTLQNRFLSKCEQIHLLLTEFFFLQWDIIKSLSFIRSWNQALVTSTALSFLRGQLPQPELSPNWASAVLGLHLAGAKLGFFSASLNLSHSTRDVGGMCNFLSSVSPQQRFEMVDQCYSSVTAEFYLASKAKYTLEAWRQAHHKGEASIRLQFLLVYICLLHTLSLDCENWAGREEGMFGSPEFGLWIFLVPFSWGFSFLCL